MAHDASMVFVAGMHRSGTSLLMQLLNKAGLATARSEDLIADSPSNQTGHWELFAVARLNDDVLSAVGSHWSAPLNDAGEPLSELARGDLGRRARELIAKELANVEVIKDPRFCLTLPFWREIFEDKVVLVTPWRHPDEVAGSLKARNGLPERYGHWLWTEYHRQLHLHAQALPRHVVMHRSLVTNPSEQLSAVGAFLSPFLPDNRPFEKIDSALVDHDAINHQARTPLGNDDALLLKALSDDEDRSPIAPPGADRRAAFGAVAVTAVDRDQTRWRLHALRSARSQP